MFRLRRRIKLPAKLLKIKTQKPTRRRRKSNKRLHLRAAVRSNSAGGSRRAALKGQTGAPQSVGGCFFVSQEPRKTQHGRFGLGRYLKENSSHGPEVAEVK